jgi:hypothetical protein
MLLKANLEEMNMEVSYLLISFLYYWISRISRLSGVIINIIFSLMFLLELMKKEKVMRW